VELNFLALADPQFKKLLEAVAEMRKIAAISRGAATALLFLIKSHSARLDTIFH
jgi:hypothetical protein